MKTVWKYPLSFTDLCLPRGFVPLHIGWQGALDGGICLWVLVDPYAVTETRSVVIVGTGHPLPEGNWAHLGTTIVGDYVWHVFMEEASA